MTLADIPSRERVVLDANILVYANQRQSRQCVELLRRCARVEVEGVVPLPMADAAHAILTRNSRECSGVFFIDDAVLAETGVTDLERYAVSPGADLLPDGFI